MKYSAINSKGISCESMYNVSNESAGVIIGVGLGLFIVGSFVGTIGSIIKSFLTTARLKKYISSEKNRMYFDSIEQLFNSEMFKRAMSKIKDKYKTLNKEQVQDFINKNGLDDKNCKFEDQGLINSNKFSILNIEFVQAPKIVSGAVNRSKGFMFTEVENVSLIVTKTHLKSLNGVEDSHDTIDIYIVYQKGSTLVLSNIFKAKSTHKNENDNK